MNIKNFDWGIGGFLLLYQVLFLVSLPLYLLLFQQHAGMWLALPVLVALCGIGVTSVYHRYYSHRTYHLHPAAEAVLLFFGTLAMQGSALRWAHDHRLHHRFVDTEKDPYSIKRGFWHAHFLWLLERRPAMDLGVVHDLAKRRLLVLQDKHYVPLVIVANLGVVALFGWVFNDYLGAFVVLFLVRLFINHHTTWFINSLAHTWGARPYSREHSAVNNWIISLLTYGEGYHNYHHTFSSDYRNGTRWYHFDPTKLLIWALSKVGLSSGLHRIDRMMVARRLVLEDKKLLLGSAKGHDLVPEIERRAEALVGRMEELSTVLRQCRDSKSNEVRARLKQLRQAVKRETLQWSRFCDHVLAA